MVELLPLQSNAQLLANSPGTVAIMTVTTAVVALCSAMLGVGRALEMRTDVVAEGQWWRAFTSLFPHTAGVPHLTVNLVFIYLYAPQLERMVGSWAFTAMYVVGGTFAMALMYALLPPGRTAGASGAVFAVIGAIVAVATFGDAAVRTGLARSLVLSAVLFALAGLSSIGGVGDAADPGFEGFLYGVIVHGLGFVAGFAVAATWFASRRSVVVTTAAFVLVVVGVLAAGTWRWRRQHIPCAQ